MAKTDKKGGLNRTIPLMTCGPLFLFGILAMFFCSMRFTSVMYQKVEQELKEIASSVLLTYDFLYPGDYELVKRGNVVAFYKGDEEITGNNELVDGYKSETKAEISLFYRDTRMVTTLTDSAGERLVGTGANTVVQQAVVEGKESMFYKRVNIYGTEYYVYYEPILTQAGGCVGMIAVAKDCDEINALVRKSIAPMIIIIAIALILVALLSYVYASTLASAIGSVRESLARVAKGDLSGAVDYKVMKRNDEISDIGKSIQQMQKSLHILIEKDALTELYNRRLASKRLSKILRESEMSGTKFCVALGDIDFFKKVNDTYSHEMGDVVLKEIARTLKNGMMGNGFASRWGGEEFLLVFENMDIDRAMIHLEDILCNIRALEIENKYEMSEKEMFGEFAGNTEMDEKEMINEDNINDIEKGRYAPVDRSSASQIIRVTMTFGLVSGEPGRDKETLVHMADDNLYYGKEHGRNQIVKENLPKKKVTDENKETV